MKKTKNFIWIIALILVIVLIGVVGYGYYQKATLEVKNPVATMEVENFGTVKMELYPEMAPETVANFIALANRGFYDGKTFHRIVKDFMIQGGSVNGDGTGSVKISDLKDGGADEAYSIKGEFLDNNAKNTLRFDEGVVGVARADYTQYSSDLAEESYNSGSCEFFIMTEDNTNLNGHYAAFGKVIEGMDVVHKIEEVEVTSGTDETTEGSDSSASSEVSTPVNPPVITSIRVETYGEDYGLPETLTPFDVNSWIYEQYGIDPNSMVSTGE